MAPSVSYSRAASLLPRDRTRNQTKVKITHETNARSDFKRPYAYPTHIVLRRCAIYLNGFASVDANSLVQNYIPTFLWGGDQLKVRRFHVEFESQSVRPYISVNVARQLFVMMMTKPHNANKICAGYQLLLRNNRNSHRQVM
jgi:hypothetical protein